MLAVAATSTLRQFVEQVPRLFQIKRVEALGCCRISGLPSSTCASRFRTFGQADRPPIAPAMRKAFSGPFVLNTDLDQAKAQNALNQTASAR